MKDIWYHIVSKDANMNKGIISPYYMATHGMESLALSSVDKYRNRITGAWNIYPDKNPNKLTLEEILSALNQFRGENGSKSIYLFRYPLSSTMGPNMEKVLKYKDIYEVDLSRVPDIIDIDYTVNDGPGKEWFQKVTPAEYFSTYDDDAEKHGKLLFAGIPHISVATKSGRILHTAIKKLSYPTLYHGSSEKYSILKTHVSQAYPDHKIVYATPYYDFALAFAGGKWNDLEINQAMIGGKHVLTEILPGSFDKNFNCKGYIHHIYGEGFYPFHGEQEYGSIWDAKPYKIETISNIMDALEHTNVILNKYPNLPNHIPNRIGYIKSICAKWGISIEPILKRLK